MPIIQAGKQFTADDLRRDYGDLAALALSVATRSMHAKAQLETWPDADLIALAPGPSGRALSQDEINAIKGYFIGDQPGVYNLLVASAWIKQLLGTGAGV